MVEKDGLVEKSSSVFTISMVEKDELVEQSSSVFTHVCHILEHERKVDYIWKLSRFFSFQMAPI